MLVLCSYHKFLTTTLITVVSTEVRMRSQPLRGNTTFHYADLEII